MLSYDEFLQEKEQQAWKVISERMDVSPEEIKMVAADFIRDDLQDIFTNNRADIRSMYENGGYETDESIGDILLDNRPIISNFANSSGVESEKEKNVSYIFNLLVNSKEVRNAAKVLPTTQEQPGNLKEIFTKQPPELQRKQAAQLVNYFHKETGSIWHIGFEGKETRIKHLNGFLYIAHLLNIPSVSITCINLYQAATGKATDVVMVPSAARGEGLNMDHKGQKINPPEIKSEYIKQYSKLRNELSKIEDLPSHERTPEDTMRKKEIESEMEKIESVLKEKNFIDPNAKKAQINIGLRLKDAYAAIRKAKMKDLAEHLEKNIKPDGAFGLRYIGSCTWDIAIQ
ncbi:MAG: hypothetical protein ABFD75_13095 [Smithella sp.]